MTSSTHKSYLKVTHFCRLGQENVIGANPHQNDDCRSLVLDSETVENADSLQNEVNADLHWIWENAGFHSIQENADWHWIQENADWHWIQANAGSHQMLGNADWHKIFVNVYCLHWTDLIVG